jgi:vacuolar-type H+-ATPase subunit F/Vma7
MPGDPLVELKKMRDDLRQSLELADSPTVLVVPRMSQAERKRREKLLREIEQSISRIESRRNQG